MLALAGALIQNPWFPSASCVFLGKSLNISGLNCPSCLKCKEQFHPCLPDGGVTLRGGSTPDTVAQWTGKLITTVAGELAEKGDVPLACGGGRQRET